MSDPPDPQVHDPGSVRKNVVAQVLLGMLLLVVLVTVLRWTAAEREEAPSPVAETNANSEAPNPPAETPPVETPPVETPPAEDALEVPSDSAMDTPPADPLFDARVSIETLADEQKGWLTIRAQSKGDQRSAAHGRYEPDNEFRLLTTNVQSFRIDMTQLPVLKNKSFILHLDGQNMKVSPKKQASLIFSRTPAGSWFLEHVEDPVPSQQNANSTGN